MALAAWLSVFIIGLSVAFVLILLWLVWFCCFRYHPYGDDGEHPALARLKHAPLVLISDFPPPPLPKDGETSDSVYDRILIGAVSGKVLRPASGSEMLEAPLSGQPCVFYQAIVYEEVGEPGHATLAVKRDKQEDNVQVSAIVEESRGIDFILKDHTGECMVKVGPNGEENLPIDCIGTLHVYRSNPVRESSQRMEDLLSRHGELAVGRFLRYVEVLIRPNMQVSVFGAVIGVTDEEQESVSEDQGAALLSHRLDEIRVNNYPTVIAPEDEPMVLCENKILMRGTVTIDETVLRRQEEQRLYESASDHRLNSSSSEDESLDEPADDIDHDDLIARAAQHIAERMPEGAGATPPGDDTRV